MKLLKKAIGVLILALLLSCNFASAKGGPVINLGDDKISPSQFEGTRIKIWKISDNIDMGDLQKFLSSLDELSQDDLDEKYKESFISSPADKDGKIQLKELGDGIYYAREYGNKDSKIFPFLIITPMSEGEAQNIHPKIKVIPKDDTPPPVDTETEEEPGKGEIKFKKVSSDGKGLAGAKFKVTKNNKDNSDTDSDNKSHGIILESDNDGFFYLKDMEYGDYTLWEIKAPDGYKPLKSGIDFTIDKKSSKKLIEIVNEKGKIPPHKPSEGKPSDHGGGSHSSGKDKPKGGTEKGGGEIPKTGDISLLVMTVSGLLLAIAGKTIIKREKEG